MPGPGSRAVPKPEPRVFTKKRVKLSLASQERAARFAVKQRDKGVCRVPGCRERSHAMHHIVFRSHSKAARWLTSNLCSLCMSHHRLVHAGKIRISGNADEKLIIEGERRYLEFRL